MSRSKLLSGGFYVTRTISRPAGLGDVLLPERLISLSSCLTEFLPDLWALDWTSCSTDEQIAAVKKLGLPEALLPTLQKSATDAAVMHWFCKQSFALRHHLHLIPYGATG
jgi:hypothetical protein